ncbi:hypothetical protein PZ897_03755 [Hoeflea sp. YIM 152468]|uniref:hypothetical protein n=1 Tax=Hoeflea sp. YIM 152468 TaxID=3031759 RepID=UPI0023DAD7AC|nr:hypothetical protein [Hoeflea sp. YIM 152468]MDF1607286.1 hypothetical protein [Hoeflea sp. YIM 152468]
MTETCGGAGRVMLSGPDRPAPAVGEAGLIDRLIDLVLALEPFEFKQREPSGADDPAGSEQAGPETTGPEVVGGGAGLSAESTREMLRRMRAVLDREAARLGCDGLEGKAAVDQVALIARTLEKIDQMERLIAEDEARAAATALTGEERDQLRQTVRQLILAAAERLAAQRQGQGQGQGEGGDEPIGEADAGEEAEAGATGRDEAG